MHHLINYISFIREPQQGSVLLKYFSAKGVSVYHHVTPKNTFCHSIACRSTDGRYSVCLTYDQRSLDSVPRGSHAFALVRMIFLRVLGIDLSGMIEVYDECLLRALSYKFTNVSGRLPKSTKICIYKYFLGK